MAFSNGYVFGFAAAICVVCSLAVSSVSLSLREKQEINKLRDERGSILGALGLPEDGRALDGPTIDKLWAERVEQRFLTPDGQVVDDADHAKFDKDGDGDLDGEDVDIAVEKARKAGKKPDVLSVFVRMDGKNPGAYAIPLSGNGLWGPLGGYLALDQSGKEIVGTTFFAPKETPGLGAEIQEPKFEDQWKGKKVFEGTSSAPVRVVKGEASTMCPDDLEHCVDGVSGATITCRGVDEMVTRAIDWYDGYLTKLRQGRS
jgi:Na+-transporting NADH:ubiquinone oxidoreductase subunit C